MNWIDENALILKIKDDGIGFEVNQVFEINSCGILGMSERALSIGGHLTIKSIREIGTTVMLQINGKNKQTKLEGNDKDSGCR